MARRVFVRVLLFALAIPPALVSLQGRCLAEGFDKPVRKVVRDLGPSPLFPGEVKPHQHLSCSYYPTFTVKELDDDWMKGSLRISVLRASAPMAPACNRSLRVGERLLSGFGGYFWGVRGEHVFRIADDGDGEGQVFDVFDARTLKTVLKDSMRFSTSPVFGTTSDGQPSMRYERIFFAKCSLMDTGPNGGMGCWAQVKLSTHIGNLPLPKCTGYDDLGDDPSPLKDPSLIGYPVEVLLDGKPVVKILPGPVHCFAQQ